MSLRTVIELALHFDGFRNVDLFHQGLYHLKTRIYREDGDQRVFAVPYGYIASPLQAEQTKSKSARTDHHHLIPAHIIEDQCTFSTRSFLIRYCEEEVELNDIGQFRIELSAEEVESNKPLLLEVDLMFADLTQHGGADRFGEQPDVDSTEFKSVSTQVLRVNGADRGLHELCPVVFDEFHFCLANIAVHSTLLDFRLRLRAPTTLGARTRPTQQPARDGQASDAHSNGQASQPSQPAMAQNAALSLGEHLFGSAGGNREQLFRMLEVVYRKYMGALASSYSSQAAWFHLICDACLTPAQGEAFEDATQLAEFELPGGIPVSLVLPGGMKGSSSSSRDVPNGHGQTLRSHLEAKFGPPGAHVNEHLLAMHLMYDFNAVSCQVLELWHKIQNVISYSCKEVATLLRGTWEQRVIDQMHVSILREDAKSELTAPTGRSVLEAHGIAADKLRKEAKSFQLQPASVEDSSLTLDTDSSPLLFDQRYGRHTSGGSSSSSAEAPRLPSAPKPYRGVHLFVLVHGFQGNSFDMRLMKNNIALLYPDAIFLCSNSNEDNTEGDFNEMGIRLAQEVVNYICDWCPGSALGRLSFIAHSIGGLITRAALPLLHEYQSKMCTFLTFSSAHAGYFLKDISLFHMGLRVLQTWRQSQCLSQLAMTDSQDPRETFLYKLSKARGFEFFKHVVLVSCPSDQYGPFDSARVEIGGMLEKHCDKDTYAEMVRNIWEPVDPRNVYRFDVNFKISEKNLDTFIGRAAHIQFLECQPIMKMIIHNYSFLFR
mmetsp:Transcript_107020/g.301090  ORF Transcript_107020/g.301090 Transcript_107020/m.301090 type:complete len:771 (-) Transcript_107020:149-2461(-)